MSRTISLSFPRFLPALLGALFLTGFPAAVRGQTPDPAAIQAATGNAAAVPAAGLNPESATTAPGTAVAPAAGQPEPEQGQMPYFDVIPDPLEGVNRCTWTLNEGLFRGILYPLSLGYNFVLPKPVRGRITNVGHNLTYPVRLVNSSLQGKWGGAWEETKRFGVNSTVGLAGIFDPATNWKIGHSEEDFGQTFGYYGTGPGLYLMLPLFGPSNGRDAVGKLLDWPLDLAFWIGVAEPDETWPMFVRPGFQFNDISDNAKTYKRVLDSENDPYVFLRMLFSLDRQRQVLDFIPALDAGPANPDPTLGAVLFAPQTPDFLGRSVTRRVKVAATGKELPYTCWMQPKPAPVVIYIPGLGSHRLDQSTQAYADMLFRHGYSVVAFTNPFQREFMELGSSMPVPGYGPADGDDVAAVLRLIQDDLKRWKGDKVTGFSLTGVSHGGYFTLMMAGREQRGELGGMTFDRYVAVNPPPNLDGALEQLDALFNAPLAWPVAERRNRMENSVYKALYFARNGLDVSGNVPLTREESRFLIGLIFRYTLACAIQNSQSRHNLGVLMNDPAAFVRQEAYREIRQISYAEYMTRFVVPYLIRTGRVPNLAAAQTATNLRRDTASLLANPKVRVQINHDDFLLSPADIVWFRTTFPNGRLAEYPFGGHLGNLHVPAVQEKLVRMFDGDEK